MERRGFLSFMAPIVFVSSGCIANDNLPDSEYEISNTDYQDVTGAAGENRPVSYSATILGGDYDDEISPVTLKIMMENTSDVTWYYQSWTDGLFAGQISEDERHQLILPEDAEDLGREFTGECWKISTYSGIPGGIPPTRELSAGEDVEQELELITPPNEMCPSNKPAIIEFLTSFRFFDDEERNSELVSGQWLFSISTG